MFRLAVVGLVVADAREYAKGFVRMPRNDVVPHATITDEMRAAAPAKLDWTETSGAVSAVKDQGQCGSCWAFSATEGVESGVFMTDGKAPPALSPQQITSCDTTDGGCNGGDLPTAFTYVENAGGLDTESDYPYTSSSGSTGSCKSHSNVVTVTDYKYAVPPCQGGSCSSQDEDGLKAALNSFGPLSVCVNAENFNSYYGGVVASGSCSGAYNKLDHCVQLVGYDTTASTPYWKVKNSWAADWGEAGYIRLPMGENACGIADEAMYVTATMNGPAPTPAPTPPAPPTPSPAPTPTPSPTPSEGQCVLQNDEGACNSIVQGGLPCRWCYLEAIDVGICLEPDDTFDDCASIYYQRQQQKAKFLGQIV
jgi:C1A family cysteine protease